MNVSSARKSCICQLAPNVVHSCLDTVRFCSFLQSKLLSITTRLSRLRPVIDGQESRRVLDKVETPQISIGHASLCTRRSGSPQLASDETLWRTECFGTELHCRPTRSVDQLREMCSSLALRSQAHSVDDVRLDTVIAISAGGSETNVTSERKTSQQKR